jgi:hypothetical protein
VPTTARDAFAAIEKDYYESLGSLFYSKGEQLFQFLFDLDDTKRARAVEALQRAFNMSDAMAGMYMFHPLIVLAMIHEDAEAGDLFRQAVKQSRSNAWLDRIVVSVGNDLRNAARAEQAAEDAARVATEEAEAQGRHPASGGIVPGFSATDDSAFGMGYGVSGQPTDDGVITGDFGPWGFVNDVIDTDGGSVNARSAEEATAVFKRKFSEKYGVPVDALAVVTLGPDGEITGDTDVADEMGLSLSDLLERFGR